MPDALFADPRLAAVYDAFEDNRDDLVHYVALITELGVHRVLDVGCGTGELALRLADQGLEVTGADPAAASLEVARAKPGADRVTWVDAEAAELPALGAELAVMTGNVAQVFLTDDDWIAALQGIRTALGPNGVLVFEARRPERRAWEDWETEADAIVREVAGVGRVEQRRLMLRVDLPFVSFRGEYRFDRTGERVVSESTLRFRDRAEIETSLHRAGLEVVDVRDAPDRPGLEWVFIARLSSAE